ncbi:glycoside hydrolase family 99-like domain-containing protein [Empedobacter sp. R132-2]|uniref:glycosyltransferase WbsX family protein n=1 Tax=Empedobacter sp. R132-2 TaxID=2746740 RepID=UPI002577FF34|nr:glycoside hydrolase family 99-like domain-containing protein [Empedobacter sp. R132-2]MDM1139258.1 glycoside hydrolase family 99-like domain-containing protein [Empedobacter sp. R132-2]
MKKRNKVRLIASYLPQFYPTEENNLWWHEGFTEWTNVGKAEKLFEDHYQPRVPRDLGYYDLRVSDIRKQQAEMAEKYGIEGFCYWHYWFGNGDRVLTRVFDEVVKSKEPDFPFCLAWANETWSGRWHGAENRILKEQKYPGVEDMIEHFNTMLPAFKDERYITINGKLFFMIYKPDQLVDTELFIKTWNDLAKENGLKGFYFVAQIMDENQKEIYISKGYSAVNVITHYNIQRVLKNRITRNLKKLVKKDNLNVYDYKDAMEYFVCSDINEIDSIPTILPNWDHSPRSGSRGFILHDSKPEYFQEHVHQVFENIKNKPEEERVAIIKSWNEWGEGNYLEPDLKFGHEYLEVILRELDKL